ncbi:hypothetical protein [Orrella daihaiensis]|uniref:Uncharacterized protein n=1 Tax=Orrella daihaiensis TaxID=2782176 RepID=A0ABY4AM89_9BURK|nr:hypothetical protein [Orrella daihaiensis]UOD51436.1 hypothetical protein DHf2319_06320 [Orrella daihaiensis]
MAKIDGEWVCLECGYKSPAIRNGICPNCVQIKKQLDLQKDLLEATRRSEKAQLEAARKTRAPSTSVSAEEVTQVVGGMVSLTGWLLRLTLKTLKWIVIFLIVMAILIQIKKMFS